MHGPARGGNRGNGESHLEPPYLISALGHLMTLWDDGLLLTNVNLLTDVINQGWNDVFQPGCKTLIVKESGDSRRVSMRLFL